MEFYFALPDTSTVKKFFLWLFFLRNIACICALWWFGSHYYITNPGGGNSAIALGRLAGLLAEFFILVQIVMIGRIKFVEELYGFDKLNIFHRWIGYSILLFLIPHPLLLVIGNATANGVGLLAQFADFLANKSDVLNAFIALALLIFIVFLSIAIVRKKLRYETWYFTHLLTYLAIGLALNHQLGTGDLREGWPLYYWYTINFGVFGLLLLYRFLRPFSLFNKHRFVIEDVVAENDDTYSIYIIGRRMEDFKFAAGQYANLTILAKGMWFAHPFSFSAAYNGAFIRFSIKSLGDYTTKIRSIAPGTRIIIDGPLGRFVETRATREKLLFIAGGIGITPLRAMLESLAAKKKDAILVYGTRSLKDTVFMQEFEYIKRISSSILVHYVLGEPTLGFETGYIDKEKIVRLVPDFYAREVFLCGPPPMMKGTVNNLRDLGFSEDHVHYEKFSF